MYLRVQEITEIKISQRSRDLKNKEIWEINWSEEFILRLVGERQTDKGTDTCDSRVAFATEKFP